MNPCASSACYPPSRVVAALRWLVALALTLVALSVPKLARADERTEARRLFRAGMDLVQRGDPSGIESLEEAYEILPHPHVLYNIARAYAEFGRYSESIEAFERYLEWDPDDAVEVTEFIASMREILAREAQRGEPSVTEPADPATGATEPAELGGAAPRPTTTERVGELRGTQRADGVYEEQVVSASRFVESSVSAPSSTTVITAQDIRMSGLQTLADVLRRDQIDSSRTHSPLRPAADAILIDSTDQPPAAIVNAILQMIQEPVNGER